MHLALRLDAPCLTVGCTPTCPDVTEWASDIISLPQFCDILTHTYCKYVLPIFHHSAYTSHKIKFLICHNRHATYWYNVFVPLDDLAILLLYIIWQTYHKTSVSLHPSYLRRKTYVSLCVFFMCILSDSTRLESLLQNDSTRVPALKNSTRALLKDSSWVIVLKSKYTNCRSEEPVLTLSDNMSSCPPSMLYLTMWPPKVILVIDFQNQDSEPRAATMPN